MIKNQGLSVESVSSVVNLYKLHLILTIYLSLQAKSFIRLYDLQ